MSREPKWINLPNWVENVLIGAILLAVGMVGGAAFTMSERSTLKHKVETLQAQLDQTTAERQQLAAQLQSLRLATAERENQSAVAEQPPIEQTSERQTKAPDKPQVAETGTNYARPADSGSSGTVQVKGYYRKDGTYVRPHTRRSPKR